MKKFEESEKILNYKQCNKKQVYIILFKSWKGQM